MTTMLPPLHASRTLGMLVGLALLLLVALFLAGQAFSESSDTGSVTVAITTVLTIDVNNSPMAFSMAPNSTDENGTSNIRFLLNNTGSTDIDITICGTALAWSGTVGSTDKNYFQFLADNNEASSCSSIQQDGNSWVGIPNTGETSKPLCETFNMETATDTLNVGIRIKSPADEPDSSTPSSTITFNIADDTTAAQDAMVTC